MARSACCREPPRNAIARGPRRTDRAVAATLTTVSANLGENIAITTPSSKSPPAISHDSTSPSPIAARAGHHSGLSSIGRIGGSGIGGQHRKARQRTVGKDGCDLQRDDEAGADDGGHDLRDEAGAARADQPEQRDRDRDRNGRGREADGDDDAERQKAIGRRHRSRERRQRASTAAAPSRSRTARSPRSAPRTRWRDSPATT